MEKYSIPGALNDFQRGMYLHLCAWKQRNITDQTGSYGGRDYDVILPDSMQQSLPHLYGPIRQRFWDHQKKFPFKTHRFAGHLASSQVACANLFLPLMETPVAAARILRAVKPDLNVIALDELDRGFRIEFWDEGANRLGDHCAHSGTDADFAIAYRNDEDELCLWLIEHKLTEAEFTTCGAYRSRANQHRDDCDANAAAQRGPEACYYHSVRKFKYWEITNANPQVFPPENLRDERTCPFKGGMNQLWRNQLLAAAIEADPAEPYKKVYFSVVYHSGNQSLFPSMLEFKNLIGQKDRFFWFTSDQVLGAAREINNPDIQAWVEWYSGLYLCGASGSF